MMDLKPYICRGFPGEFDRIMRDVPVAGIDREQAHSMVRLCAETEATLYGPEFSARRIRYRRGARPKLEAIARGFAGDVAAATTWVREHVRHPNLGGGDVRPDRGMSEEELIESRVGWCNEQCRVCVALCEVMEAPARLVFLFHANGRTGHTACEVFVDGKWRVCDITYGIWLPEARRVVGDERRRAHALYETPLAEYYRGRTAPFDLSRGGDFFESVGICNYLIDGVEVVDER